MSKTPTARITSFLLAVCIVFSLAACSDVKQTDNPTTAANQTESTSAAQDNPRYAVKEELPDVKYDGYTFRILSRDTYEHLREVDSEAETGEIINDTVFRRNRAVEEKLGVTIQSVPVAEFPEDTLTNTLEKNVLAGEDAFDLALAHTVLAGGVAQKGLLYNWHDLQYVDFSKPWWNSVAVDELTINDKLYVAVSDLCISAMSFTWSMLYNKQLAKDYAIDNLYDVIKNGDWTFDYFNKTLKLVSGDLDGNGTYDDKDLYGFVTHDNSALLNWMYAFDQKVTAKAPDGSPEIVLNTEKMAGIVNGIYDLLFTGNSTYLVQGTTTTDSIYASHDIIVANMFSQDQALFAALRIFAIDQLRNMDSDYGIIPFPKYDKAQDGYYTHVDGRSALMLVPSTITDPDRTGAVIEALSAESYREIVPAYYDVVLQSKYSRDEESREMLDILMKGRTYTFAYVYDNGKGLQWSLVRLMQSKSKDFASFYSKNEVTAQKHYESVMAAYQDID